jgi:hypothetical protein
MKYFILTALSFMAFFAATAARAQITLEHTYAKVRQFGLVQVDSNEWRYVTNNGYDSITLFNLDHSLDRVIHVILRTDTSSGSDFPFLLVIAKGLFSNDSSYGFLVASLKLQVYKEDGTILLSLSRSGLQTPMDLSDVLYEPVSIKTTDRGTKMIVVTDTGYQVYSLPGRLPSGQQMLSVGGSSPQTNMPSIATMPYPNPSSGQVRIEYALPPGAQSGDLILTSIDGRELKRYHITSAFPDLLIEPGDLPSGSYFYKIITEKGESAARKIVRE